MPKIDLLPGVKTAECPPRVICDAHAAIRRARRRALFRDAVQITLVVAVDFLFVYWPESRIPLFDRDQSLALVRGVNVLVIADVWLCRAMPKWSARRIAATWSRVEQTKFDTTVAAKQR